jgi:bifunctional NMN adenylyltransferase/nudix hydrolase
MSHDRGCPCGRESYEYADCKDNSCNKKPKQAKRDALVFIGRMQPFHNGHKAVIERALSLANEVVVVLGSSFSARSLRNPFTFSERKAMIEACFTDPRYFNYYGVQRRVKLPRIKIVPVSDYPFDDDKWVSAIQTIVDATVPDANDVGLIGHSKDSSSYYLNIFPKWKNHVEVENVSEINATDIRNNFLKSSTTQWAGSNNVPEPVNKWLLHNFEAFDTLRAEYKMIQKYKESWKAAPFSPIFVTTDAVVVQSGHVLLIERGRAPGKGLLALPGGFLNPGERIEDGMIRELHEETKIKLQPQVLRGSIEGKTVVDTPDRDPRGRTITHAFYLKLKDQQDLPHVRGSDDAAKATWYTFSDVLKMRDCFYADHFHILAHFLKIG